jgi:cell division protein FtsX
MPTARDTRQVIPFLLLGALVGVIGGVLMAILSEALPINMASPGR